MYMKATIPHGKDDSGTIYAAMRFRETPPAKTENNDLCQKQVYMIQDTGDMVAWSLDRRTSNVQEAVQLMDEKSQGSRNYTPNTD